jgi:hypothetical protein
VPATPQQHAVRHVASAMTKEIALGSGPHVREGYRPSRLIQLGKSSGLVDISVQYTFHRRLSRLAADVDTWTYLRGIKPIKALLLPALLAAAALERAPSEHKRGNALLFVGRRPN